jgi:predicted lipoprotein with Yx(FWY)xxD motif
MSWTILASRPRAGAAAGRPDACRATRWCLVVAAVALALAGCGGGSGSSAPAYEVQATTIAGLGKVLADGQGFTLYMYAPDHQGASTCAGICAKQWPPLVLPRGVTRPTAGPGISTALLGTVRRSDGTLQVTYNRWPLYLWQGDTAPGQATGQAYDMGLWYTLSISGAVDRGTPS